jgi:uncharacterized protein
VPVSRSNAVVETVVVQPTPFCNIACRYCYLPARNVTTVIEQSTVSTLFEKLFATGWTNPELTVIWHAGEPLVVPIAFYEQAFANIEALRPAGIHVRHSFQTNGMLITPEWCEFFSRWQVGVGVSIDGPKPLHDANRVTRNGRGTFDQSIAGLRLLRQHNVVFHVISVLTAAAMQAPQAMLEFYESEGIDNVCFNVEESEGDHVSALFAGADAQANYKVFLNEFWRRARRSGRIKFLREIDGMLPRVFRPSGTEMINAQVQPFGMLNVDCSGNVSTFSPELLGLKNADYSDFIVGNINTDSFDQMQRSSALAAMSRDIQQGVDACRQHCEYFSVCGGGAPVNKLSENGSFATSQTSFCSLVYMAPTDLILNALDHLERGIDKTAHQLRLSGTAPISMDRLQGARFQGAPNAAHAGAKTQVPNRPDVPLHQIQRGTR